MKLTKQLIDACRTEQGAFSDSTAELLGAKLPLVRGWPAALVGCEVSEVSYAAALQARHLRGRCEPRSHITRGQLGFDL